MKIEDQVCSLENAKKLAELGVTVESLFAHSWMRTRVKGENGFEWGQAPLVRFTKGAKSDNRFVAPAYTVAELGEMLPTNNVLLCLAWEKAMLKGGGSEYSDAVAMMRNPNIAVRMLIWLIENNHVTVEELKR